MYRKKKKPSPPPPSPSTVKEFFYEKMKVHPLPLNNKK
jgi:hypothetical protein